MIRSSKSLPSLFILFLCIFFSSRYIQRIFFEKDLVQSPLAKLRIKSTSCKPRKNSLLSYYIKNNKKVLFVVIDAFPNTRIYEELIGKDSKLHKYLNKSSEETVFVSGASQKTFSSLPYLMGKISPLDNCRYPFFSGSVKTNLMVSSKFLATNKAICPSLYNSVSKNAFVRYANKIRKVIDPQYVNRLKEDSINCALNNKLVINEMVEKLRYLNSSPKGSINFFHEIQFHSPGFGRERKTVLPFYDSEYYQSIKYLIKRLKESTNIDELIVMNDHGPRILKKNFSASNAEELNLYDQMYYGVFVSRFRISDDKNNFDRKILDKLIPSSKIRFCDDGFGNIKQIEDLKELEFCF
tara:strand:+ start:5364 stop:6422 length:1059 start_codon:yes stop_codon:yes gene_type:complete